MRIGIIGLPNSGKKTLFRLLTGVEAVSNTELKSIPGIAEIRDDRFNYLSDFYKPKKKSPAQISMELMPGLDKRIIGEGNIFKDIANLDALCLVVRLFKDDSIYHPDGSVNPERDIDEISGEFILHDLIFIEKRMDRISKNLKKQGMEQYKKEEAVIQAFKRHLESNQPLRTYNITGNDRKIIAGYPFITLKELIIVLNAGDELAHGLNLARLAHGLNCGLSAEYQSQKINIIEIPIKLESEIDALDSDEERREFMAASGIMEPAINLLSRQCMEALGLISFFTVGKDEVKQWLTRKGSLAPEAAGVIHSDIQRGFIRAEVMKYNEFREYGSEEKLKQAGKYYIMGRDYTIEDGDIIGFRFNV